MTTQKPKYVVGQRPPVKLTAKAREQLEAVQSSPEVEELGKLAARLISRTSSGRKFVNLPGVEPLKPGNGNNLLTAKEAAKASRKSSAKRVGKNTAGAK